MNDEQLTIFRRRNIGFIFQNYNLVPILNVYENIVLPVEPVSYTHLSGNLTRIDNDLAQMPQRLEAAKAQLDNLYQQQMCIRDRYRG